MAESGSGLFRKSTLERVSSPEQLNEYIKVTNPSLIVILMGIFIILVAGVVWIFSSGIPQSVSLSGVIINDNTGVLKAYSYVTIADSKRLEKGMRVQISPDYAPREEYGYQTGHILSVGQDVVTNDYINEKFNNPQLVIPTLTVAAQSGNVVEVEMSLEGWSSEHGDSVQITDGTVCKIVAVVGETKPYELIFNK